MHKCNKIMNIVLLLYFYKGNEFGYIHNILLLVINKEIEECIKNKLVSLSINFFIQHKFFFKVFKIISKLLY